MFHRSAREISKRTASHVSRCLSSPPLVLSHCSVAPSQVTHHCPVTRQLTVLSRRILGSGTTPCPGPTSSVQVAGSRHEWDRWQRSIISKAAMPERVDVPPEEETDIHADDLIVLRTLQPKQKPELSKLKFGHAFTDHMLQVTWKKGEGWSAPSIHPLTTIEIHPCAQALQYGMECFEGMKAYRGVDGRIRLFRPRMNMARLAKSCSRLSLPSFDKGQFLECIKELLKVERDWLPKPEGFSLYLRPTAIATTPIIGIGPPTQAMIYVVLSPVGPYFPTGLKPVKLAVDTMHVRAFAGGVGDCKVGGNYAPTIIPQVDAAARGCAQVLYVLDDRHPEGGLVGESGSMNVFFLIRGKPGPNGEPGRLELVTPPLDGTILPGVMRDSVLQLCRAWGGIDVSERPIRMGELEEAAKESRLLEIFGSGTACMIQPIASLLKEDGFEIRAPFDEAAASHWIGKKPGAAFQNPSDGEPVSLIGRLTRALSDIQYGHVEWKEWSVPINH
eukprot:TRINITY_DN589_c0_g1_i1.p1 TRINITY_DN589_c0_g1~~TRINITY_DN589_c0_g1_i1.p1  ORF type:complete len:501 (-),score=49.87 TRINITY_DN589_c0_g1_i1:535-2037(-)